MSMKQAIQQIGQHAGMTPRERGITMPIISLASDGDVLVRRLIYYTRVVFGEGTYITEPQYMGLFNLTQDRFVTVKRCPGLRPPNLAPTPWIHNPPVFTEPAKIIAEWDRIYGLYDLLIPAFVAQQGAGGAAKGGAVKAEAREYMDLFRKHAEEPLLPYYQHLGGDFLRWVDDTAK
jgi:hypothetical protein